MSIARLRQVAGRKLPFNVSDFDEVDEVRALMTAGLIAGLRVRSPAQPNGASSPMVRVLAITADGYRLLRRCDAMALDSPPAALPS
ncbi:hypothetical protein [Variovorax sp. UMC13]|uniref:hypothetical protein n=1 Tax=Variovorax sp. UMC13 TaxID=1862326 RepID=UPI00160098E2|nr:hypothetical protein [Variovorax sp. UMC13]MBB1600468.1 hypothetical protein [Variovorax sp. UMC13]